MAVGRVLSWCVEGICGWSLDVYDVFGSDPVDNNVVVEAKVVSKDGGKTGKKKTKLTPNDSSNAASTAGTAKASIADKLIFKLVVRAAWVFISYRLFTRAQPKIRDFQRTCDQMAVSMSHPTIVFKVQSTSDGRPMLMDDYREAYWWLRDNTPEDARIMAWWDYGYQITAIANRTTIADGNTWNHEHIALLGRALTSSLKEGHRIARHLADYVLLWTGGGGDDLAKSPHLARIANSVYRNMCPGDPTCSKFGFPGGQPTPMLAASLLYRLHSNGIVPGVDVDKNRFKEVYKSKYGKVRIYKILSVSNESKEWVLNNRICDAPGSWYCRGQYPPGLQKVLKEKKDFAQLEDFNAKRESDEEYQRKYFEHLR
jgi:dolichyl-diphosphooligosaccharide--protein glycosyltransferase